MDALNWARVRGVSWGRLCALRENPNTTVTRTATPVALVIFPILLSSVLLAGAPSLAEFRAQKEAPFVRGTNGVDEHGRMGPFQNISHRAQCLGLLHERLFLMHSEKNDLWPSPMAQFRHGLEAVHERHRDVRHDDFRAQTVILLQERAAVRNGTDDFKFFAQNTLELPEKRGIVVGQ